jgi:hypothetical protein
MRGMRSKLGGMARGRRIRRIGAALAAAGVIVAGIVQVSAAQGPSTPPTAATGAATDVTLHTATLHGTVNPNGAKTTYYFRYGPTTPLAQRTPVQSAGAGTADVAVAAPVDKLSWGRKFEYRLVAENAHGSDAGVTHEFRTHEPHLFGRYVARLRVRSGGHPFGQRRGMRVKRNYRLDPRDCGEVVCAALRLTREGKHGHFRDRLEHRSRGVFVGTDRFRGWCDDGLRFRSKAKTRIEVRRASEGRATELAGSLRVRAHGCIRGRERATLKASGA